MLNDIFVTVSCRGRWKPHSKSSFVGQDGGHLSLTHTQEYFTIYIIEISGRVGQDSQIGKEKQSGKEEKPVWAFTLLGGDANESSQRTNV